MNGTFKLEIELGNDAMQTKEDVAQLLERIACDVKQGFGMGAPAFRKDENGNTVARWEYNTWESTHD